MNWRRILPVSLLALSASAAAEIVDVGATGFQVRHVTTVNVAPAAAFAVLLEPSKWWHPAHSFSGNAANLSLDARAGGCFCERLPGGGGAEHLRVVHVAPGQMLRLAGALGPLQVFGLAGSLTWRLADAPPGTRIELTYDVGGHLQGGFDKIASAVNDVLGVQIARFRAFADTGNPAPQ